MSSVSLSVFTCSHSAISFKGKDREDRFAVTCTDLAFPFNVCRLDFLLWKRNNNYKRFITVKGFSNNYTDCAESIFAALTFPFQGLLRITLARCQSTSGPHPDWEQRIHALSVVQNLWSCFCPSAYFDFPIDSSQWDECSRPLTGRSFCLPANCSAHKAVGWWRAALGRYSGTILYSWLCPWAKLWVSPLPWLRSKNGVRTLRCWMTCFSYRCPPGQPPLVQMAHDGCTSIHTCCYSNPKPKSSIGDGPDARWTFFSGMWNVRGGDQTSDDTSSYS